MTEGEHARLIAWAHEMRAVHARLREALDRDDPPERLHSHLEGLGAIMESHFRYEERALLAVLETLDLDADPTHVLGPL